MSTNVQRQKNTKGKNPNKTNRTNTNKAKHPIIKKAQWEKKDIISSEVTTFADYTITETNGILCVSKEGKKSRYIELNDKPYTRSVGVFNFNLSAVVVIGEGDEREMHIFSDDIFDGKDYYKADYARWLKFQKPSTDLAVVPKKAKVNKPKANRVEVKLQTMTVNMDPSDAERLANMVRNVNPVNVAKVYERHVDQPRLAVELPSGGLPDSFYKTNPFAVKTVPVQAKVVETKLEQTKSWADYMDEEEAVQTSSDDIPKPKRRPSLDEIYDTSKDQSESTSSETKKSSDAKKNFIFRLTRHFDGDALRDKREDKRLKAPFAGAIISGDDIIIGWAVNLDKVVRRYFIIVITKNNLQISTFINGVESRKLILEEGSIPLEGMNAYIHHSDYKICERKDGREIYSLFGYLHKLVTNYVFEI